MTKTNLVPEHFEDKNVPSSKWRGVKESDIGAAYSASEDIFTFEEKSLDLRLTNRFVKGRSDFLFFVTQPKLQTKKIRRKVIPVNALNKVTSREKRKFVESLDKNINRLSEFFLEELLPVTMSINSAIDRVNEKTQQLADTSAEVPVAYLRSKAVGAISLRIVRFLTEQFGLTKEEAKILREGLDNG